MDGAERRIPGAALLKRMEARERRRPRLGMSPEFYARLGLDDPWHLVGAQEAPAAASPDGLVFLSAAPYYAMMRKLANARKRRERREVKFQERRAGTQLRAAKRAWPGEGRLPAARLHTLALDSMSLPEAPPPVVVQAPGAAVAAEPAWRPNVPTPSVANPWYNTPWVPARVAKPAPTRGADRAGERLAVAMQAASDERAMRSGSAAAGPRAAAAVEVVRRSSVPRPVVRYVDEVVAASPAAPVTRAVRRGSPAERRAPLSRSPSLQAASFVQAAEYDRAAVGALAAPERGESMRPHAQRRVPATQRMAARGERARGEAGGLSASPVSSARVTAGRPLSAAPVVRPAVSSEAGGSPRGSARAVARLGEAPVELVETRRPTTARLVANEAGAVTRPVRRLTPVAEGALPQRELAAAELSSAPAGAARAAVASTQASPTQASPTPAASAPVAAISAPASLRAAARAQTPVASSTSLVPRPMAAARAAERSASGVASAAWTGASSFTSAPTVRRSAAVRVASGEYVPAQVAMAREGEAQRAESAAAASRGTFVGPAAPAVGTARGPAAPLRGLSAPDAVTLRGGAASPAAVGGAPSIDERSLPAAGAPAGAASASARSETVSATKASAARSLTQELARAAGPAASASGLAWAAARAPALSAPVERSALPRAVAATAAFAPAVMDSGAAPAPVARLAKIAQEVASSGSPRPRVATTAPAGTVVSPTVSSTGEASVGRPGAVAPQAAPAASRGESPTFAAGVAPRRQAERAQGTLAHAAARVVPTPSAPGAEPTARRTGPLSWARPAVASPLVASTVGARSGAAGRGAGTVAARSASSVGTPTVLAGVAGAASSGSGASAGSMGTAGRGSGASRSARSVVSDFVMPSGSLPEVLTQLAEAGLVQSSWSPSTPVRTPDGRYVSARVAQATPGLAILPASAGPTAVSTRATDRSAGPTRGAAPRTPEVRFVGAPAQQTEAAVYTPARSARTRPTEWVAARTGVADATAYRGAMAVRSGATTFATPDVAFAARAPVMADAEPAVLAPGAARRAARRPTAEAQTDATAPRAGAAPQARSRPARSFNETVLAVASDAPSGAEPTWAARSDGTPRVRSAQGLFESLARATTAEQVVGVIAARAGEMTGPVPMSEPMRAVVDQIRQELRTPTVAAEPAMLRTRESELTPPSATVLRSRPSGPVASSATVRSGSVRPVRSSAVSRGAGGADDRVSKLVKRLTDLIHLAENERRLSEAQAQVRMAEDTAAARAEGSAPVGAASGGDGKLDIEVFAREVLEVVNRELELRRERRTEDGDESNWW